MQITFDSTNPAEVAAVHAATSELVRRTATDWELPAPTEPSAPVAEAKILDEVVQNLKADPVDSKQEVEQQLGDDYSAAAAVDTDSTGAEWDPELHSSSRAKNADGTWKKRRNSGAKVTDAEVAMVALGAAQTATETVAKNDASALVPTPPAPPAPPAAPAAEDDPFVKIMALLTGQVATVTQAKEAAQRQGLKDLGDLRVNGTHAQKLAVLRELEGE